MSYRLRTGEDLAAGIRRIAREQLESALGEISTVAGGDEAAAAVHATRKDIKKLRALLRLIREKIGQEIFREENGRLREVARGFAAPRDARVQLQLVENLRAQAGAASTAFAETTTALQAQIAERTDSFGPQRRSAKATLQWIGDRLEGWPLEDLKIEDLCCALQFSYERGRKCFRAARTQATAHNLHTWRKRVKDIWYQARLLQSLKPVVISEITKNARTLGQQLGDLHDLAFFRVRLDAEAGREEERAVLCGLICTRERELEEIALDLGARFFAEKPGAFARRLLRYARAWPGRVGSA
jgi:CHAD domain-containing protein